MDDCEAVRRMKGGDIGGLETLIARYQVKAMHMAYLITHDELMAEDVTQETFLRMFHAIRHFDEKRDFEPYFLRSVANAALSAIEKAQGRETRGHDARGSRAPEPLPGEDGLENLIASAASVEDQVIYAQLVEAIDAALGKLAPRQRLVVVQRYYLGMSEKEMAQALEAPAGTVKRLLFNARARLETLLGSERNS